jgi:protein-tyrosine-phosphatase
MPVLADRARRFAALGDVARLAVVELLADGDLSVQELGVALGLPGNLLAHHLSVLEEAGLIARHVSEGDRRRRYVTLVEHDWLPVAPERALSSVVFVCNHNSARSQYAEARWSEVTGSDATSAGLSPASSVNPKASRVARQRGLDLTGAIPKGYEAITEIPDLLVSVCDRAREALLPHARAYLHWSIPDPVAAGSVAAFRSAFDEIDRRVESLANRTMKGE